MTEMNTENNLEAMQRAHGPLLEVKNLQVDFTTDEGKAVHCLLYTSRRDHVGCRNVVDIVVAGEHLKNLVVRRMLHVAGDVAVGEHQHTVREGGRTRIVGCLLYTSRCV